MGVSRRTLLGGAVALTGAAVALRAPWVADATAPAATASPFTLGVASGDPTPDGVVLWTRLAPDPLAPDGRGGMPPRPVLVEWEVAADAGFRAPLARGSAVARAEDAHAVHVEVAGLRPAAEHFYRFRVGTEVSPAGRARTAPAPGARVDRFAFAIASCQSRPDGYYNAHAAIAPDDLDLVAWLGDYIYESAAPSSPDLPTSRGPRAVSLATTATAPRAVPHRPRPAGRPRRCSRGWSSIDDHDVENNWADDVPQADDEPDDDPAVFLARRADAYRAF